MNRFSPRALARGRALAQRARALTGPSPENGKPRDWYRFSNETGADGEPTTVIYVYDAIDSWGGYWGVSAQDFIQELMAVTTATIELRVNSPGGEVFEAVAMFAVLEAHPASVTAYVDGLVASAASFLIMAADKVVMHRNSELMIHDAHGIAFGNAAVMLEMKEILDRISDNIASIYAEKAGGTPEEWRATMIGEDGRDGKWYSAEEALAAGLVDEVTEKAGSGESNTAATRARVTNTEGDEEVTPVTESEEDTPDPTVDDDVSPDPSTVGLPEDVNLADLIKSAFANTKEAAL